MRAPSERPWALRFARAGRGVRRVRDVIPFTGLGVCVGLGAAAGLRAFAFARLDLVWLVVAYALLGLFALDVLLVVVATVVLKLRLRAPVDQVLQTQTETPTLTGFVPPRWTFVPLLRVQHEVLAPGHASRVASPWAGRVTGLGDGSVAEHAEWVRFERRGEVKLIERRVVVSDVLGLAQLAFRLRQELTATVQPHPGALERMPVLVSLAAGDEQAHPLGAADGDRIELRRYQPGDPARFIHWKIYARTGKLLVRQPERSLTQTTRTVAYLIAGPRDEASAAAARVALEQGALGDDWLFGADGTPTPASDLAAALDAVVRSGDTHPSEGGASGDTHPSPASEDTHPSGLEPFLQEAEQRGPARIVIFVPPSAHGWVSSLASLLTAAASRPGRVHVVIGVDGVSRRASRSLAVRLLRSAAPPADDDVAALEALRATLQAAGVDSVVVDRRSGQVLADAHLRAASEAA